MGRKCALVIAFGLVVLTANREPNELPPMDVG
jgi:hypothetical protein